MHFAGRDGVTYTVVGTGRLEREVLLPRRSAERLEPRLLDVPALSPTAAAATATLGRQPRPGLQRLVPKGQHGSTLRITVVDRGPSTETECVAFP